MVKFTTNDLNRILSIRNLQYHSGFVGSEYSFNVECTDCRYVFSTNLYAVSRCKNCKLEQDFSYYIDVISRLGFQYISGKYQNKNSSILVIHKICGYKFFTTMKRIIRGDGCARCSRKEKLSIDQISKLVVSRNMDVLSHDYKNSHVKLIWRCTTCGLVWKSNWDNIREGHGCPNCNKLVGNKNPNWRGGSSSYPKEWNRSIKEFVRNRDNRKCQFPLCTYTDIVETKKLHVHHISGIKDDCSPRNLISLCNSHHQYVERHNPRSWEEYFYALTKDYE